MPLLSILAASALLSCTATDGDTLRCGAERVRLIGIDAPELPGHCRRGRRCAEGDPWASKDALQRLVRGRPIRLERHGEDIYGRTLAFAWAGKVSLSCAQLRAGQAEYVQRWDIDGRAGRCR